MFFVISVRTILQEKVSDVRSDPRLLVCGVSQSSALRQAIFILYARPLSRIITVVTYSTTNMRIMLKSTVLFIRRFALCQRSRTAWGRMRNVRVIFGRVTMSLELFLSSKSQRLRGHFKRVKCIVNGSGDRYKEYSV